MHAQVKLTFSGTSTIRSNVAECVHAISKPLGLRIGDFVFYTDTAAGASSRFLRLGWHGTDGYLDRKFAADKGYTMPDDYARIGTRILRNVSSSGWIRTNNLVVNSHPLCH